MWWLPCVRTSPLELRLFDALLAQVASLACCYPSVCSSWNLYIHFAHLDRHGDLLKRITRSGFGLFFHHGFDGKQPPTLPPQRKRAVCFLSIGPSCRASVKFSFDNPSACGRKLHTMNSFFGTFNLDCPTPTNPSEQAMCFFVPIQSFRSLSQFRPFCRARSVRWRNDIENPTFTPNL